MRLLPLLILRLMAVVLLCLSLAITWVLVNTHRTIEWDTEQTASRMSEHLQGLYWQKLLWRDGLDRIDLLPLPEWETLTTQSIVSPGVCVTFAPPGAEAHRLCSQVEALGPAAPEWFANGFVALFGAHEPVKKWLFVRNKDAGLVVAEADSNAALRLAWRQISTIVGVASTMAAAIAVLAAAMIGHALFPARAIIEALRKLEDGKLSWRLPRFRSAEFDHIAHAFNGLADKLLRTNEERLALTTRLFQVQEEERRALARDLHDEFGQSLSATAALAALIEGNAKPEQHEIVSDAKAISRAQKHMMESLRNTLVRLRSQNIEELGLEASLRQLISDHNSQSSARTSFTLDVVGRIAELQKRVAVDLYRIAQECLTNACKHGNPSEVLMRIERVFDGGDHIELTVEDDGGGDVARFNTASGHGLLGIRERLSSLGGQLSIANAAHGIRVSAIIPLSRSEAYA